MRRFASSACFTLGSIWATVGAFKLLFGVALTLPILPPLGLEHVDAWPSIGVGLVLVGIGTFLARRATEETVEDDALLAERVMNPSPLLLHEPVDLVVRPPRSAVRPPDSRWR